MEGLVEQATSEGLIMPDWGRIMEIADRANSSSELARDTVRALKKRLSHKNRKVVILALQVLDTCVKNCDHHLHSAAGSRDGIAVLLQNLAEGKQNPDGKPDAEVTHAALALVQELGIAFASQASTLPFKSIYDGMVQRGVRFPTVDVRSILVHPVPTPSGPAALHEARTAALPGQAAAGRRPSFGMPPGLAAAGTPTLRPVAAPMDGVHPVSMSLGSAPAWGRPSTQGAQGLSSQYSASGMGPPAGLSRLPLEQQLAAVDSAFESLRADLHTVRVRVAGAAHEGVEGRTGPHATAWVDAVDFCDQCISRLQPLVEVGVSGVLDEGLFEECLAVNEACARIWEAGKKDFKRAEEGAGHVDNPEAEEPHEGRTYPELSDLVRFDRPGEPSFPQDVVEGAGGGGAGGGGADDLLGLFGGTGAAARATAHVEFAPTSVGASAVDPFSDMGKATKTDIAHGLDDFEVTHSGMAPGPAPAPAPVPTSVAGATSSLQAEIDDLLRA